MFGWNIDNCHTAVKRALGVLGLGVGGIQKCSDELFQEDDSYGVCIYIFVDAGIFLL